MAQQAGRSEDIPLPSAAPVAVVTNPVAGGATSRAIVTELTRRLRAAGRQVLLYRTGGPGEAPRFLAEVAGRCSAVVAVGGDGTVREVVEGLIDCPKPILIVPAGTENIVAKEFRCRVDVERLWQTFQRGRVRRVDVGLVNDRPFLIVAGVGFDAEVVDRLVDQRAGHITHLSYFWPLWRTFWEHRFWPVRVVVDGEPVYHGPGLVFVGNLARYSLGLRILRDAHTDDGMLDVCIYRCRWQGRLLLHACRTILRTHVGSRGVIYRRCRRVEVTSDGPLTVQADGDPAGKVPVSFSVVPGAALFLEPPC